MNQKLGIVHITKFGEQVEFQLLDSKLTFAFDTNDIKYTAKSFEIRSRLCSIDEKLGNAIRKYLLHKCERIRELREIELSKRSIDKEDKVDLEFCRRTESISISKALPKVLL